MAVCHTWKMPCLYPNHADIKCYLGHVIGHRQNQISGYSEVGIAPGLGPGDRAFEPHYSDQKPSEIVDFRGLFLFFVYCGAEGEKRIFNVCQIENITEICYNIKKEV